MDGAREAATSDPLALLRTIYTKSSLGDKDPCSFFSGYR